jgi:hypothetical protein
METQTTEIVEAEVIDIDDADITEIEEQLEING